MTSLSLSLSLSTPTHCFASYNKQRYALRSPQCHHTRISHHKLQHSSSFLGYNPLRVSIDLSGGMMRKRRGGAVCYAAPLTPTNLQWVCAISSLLMFVLDLPRAKVYKENGLLVAPLVRSINQERALALGIGTLALFAKHTFVNA